GRHRRLELGTDDGVDRIGVDPAGEHHHEREHRDEDRDRRGGDDTGRALVGQRVRAGGLHRSCAVWPSISSAALITRELISYARWPEIRSIISSTTLTLDTSSMPWRIAPAPPSPGAPSTAVPEARVSRNNVPPWAARPDGLANIASCSLPSSTGCVLVGIVAEIVPSAEIDTDWASGGTVMSPAIENPSPFTRRPSELRWSAPLRVS